MLKHKLMRTEPATMAELMAIADKYATADSAMQKPIRLDAAGKQIEDQPAKRSPPGAGEAGSSRRSPRDRRGKRKDDQPDGRYGSKQVAVVDIEQPAAGGSRRQKADERPWRPKFTFEQMLDAPCKYHSGAKPATHTTRQCSWTKRLSQGEALPPPPPRTAGGGRDDRDKQPARSAGAGYDDFPRQDAAYVVFTSEPDDKRNQRLRVAEVNAIVPRPAVHVLV